MCMFMSTLLFTLIYFIQLVVIKIYPHNEQFHCSSAIHSFIYFYISFQDKIVSEVKNKPEKPTITTKLFFVICSNASMLAMKPLNFCLKLSCFIFTSEEHYHLVCNSSLAVIFIQHFKFPMQLPSAFICCFCWEASCLICAAQLIFIYFLCILILEVLLQCVKLGSLYIYSTRVHITFYICGLLSLISFENSQSLALQILFPHLFLELQLYILQTFYVSYVSLCFIQYYFSFISLFQPEQFLMTSSLLVLCCVQADL